MIFSIIIPAYNASRYIARCLESVKVQTFTDFECIIVNDGSKDDTLELCRSLTSGDTRFVLVDIPNGGVSNARNKGLEQARGEYVLFVDADDWVEPTWLEVLSRSCDGVDVVQFDYSEVGDDSRQEIHIDSNLGMIIRGDGAVVWKRAYRRALIADLRFDTTVKAGEDYLFKYPGVSPHELLQAYRQLSLQLFRRQRAECDAHRLCREFRLPAAGDEQGGADAQGVRPV